MILASFRRTQSRILEEYAILLSITRKRISRKDITQRTVCEALGTRFFTLLELLIPEGIKVEIGERVYVGKGFRMKVEAVLRILNYEELSNVARTELRPQVVNIVKSEEQYFVNFFNNSIPVNIRLHELALIPGIGKKTMWKILEERKRAPFESFEDISKRADLKDPVDCLVERIMEELTSDVKHPLFVAKPIKKIYPRYALRASQ